MYDLAQIDENTFIIYCGSVRVGKVVVKNKKKWFVEDHGNITNLIPINEDNLQFLLGIETKLGEQVDNLYKDFYNTK